MARLFRSEEEASVDRDGEPSVLYADDEAVGRICAALSADSALAIFRLLTDRPLAASEVAGELDLSVQNACYHLQKLRDAGLIEVVDTCYSEKGSEMKIYAVTSDPKVLVLGSEEDGRSLRRAVGQLSAAVGVPAVLVAAWRSLADLTRGLTDV
jgi:DNA-binding transcriptional ArsR family regulator